MFAVLLTGLLVSQPMAAQHVAADTVVVCPEEFREALGPWLHYRAGQGHQAVVVSNLGSAGQIGRQIRELAHGGRLRFVVLVGDVEVGMWSYPKLRARCVPTHYAKAEVNVLWGSEPHIATDNAYADLDNDGVPELAVGRLSVDTPQQLRALVEKVIAYERSTDFGRWRRRVNVVAGVGGFGWIGDKVLDTATRFLLSQGIPGDYRASMTFGNWRSPYCPNPRLFHAAALERLNEGAWFWVYLGHGQPLGLDHVHMPDGHYPIFSVDDVAKLRCARGAPIVLLLACHTGAFDASVDCLAERMVGQPRGPVAAVAGSRVTMPYAMSVLTSAMMEQLFKQHRPTLGEVILHAKRQAVAVPDETAEIRKTLDAIGAAISPAPRQLAAERAEHLLLFNLLGDPLLRLRYPETVALECPTTASAGEPLHVSGVSPTEGRAVVELVVPRHRRDFEPPARSEYSTCAESLAQMQQTYRRANDRQLAAVESGVSPGRFEVKLDVPEHARGACRLRVFIEGGEGFSSGHAMVDVR